MAANAPITHANRLVVLLILAVGSSACLTPHAVLGLADYQDGASQRDNAHQCAVIGRDRDEDPNLRLLAFEVLGKLRVYDDEVAASLAAVLGDKGAPAPVRARAAWALGEIGRDLAWQGGGERLHQILLAGMNSPVSADTAYYLVEALGKIYFAHHHPRRRALATAAALSRLAAHQTEAMPGLYYVVLQKVATLEVLIALLEEAQDGSRTRRQRPGSVVRSPSASGGELEVYDAVLNLLRFFEANQAQLLASFGERRQRITAALRGSVAGLGNQSRTLSLLVIWYLGRVARAPELVRIVATELAAQASHSDPVIRLVAAWSATKLADDLAIREGLRQRVLAREQEPEILRLLHVSGQGDPGGDIIQRLFNVRLTASAS